MPKPESLSFRQLSRDAFFSVQDQLHQKGLCPAQDQDQPFTLTVEHKEVHYRIKAVFNPAIGRYTVDIAVLSSAQGRARRGTGRQLRATTAQAAAEKVTEFLGL